jgi:hypothetical protein
MILVAFFAALIVGSYTHYNKIVRNEFYGYPDEWFPSVSATIGDRYPARSIFQILIALTAGPRFAILILWYLCMREKNQSWLSSPNLVFGVGLVRTVACGIFVYITSTDHGLVHDSGMILYILCTLFYMPATIRQEQQYLNPSAQRALVWRKRLCAVFFGSLVPLIYLYIQHKVHQVKGAYSYYALVEWSLIIYDVAFDACSSWCLSQLTLQVVNTGKANAFSKRQSVHGKHQQPVIKDKPSLSETILHTANTFTRLDKIYFCADVYLGFVFWSLLTAVPLAIWYFPLWNMGLSGDEVYLFANLGSIVLAVPIIRRLLRTHLGVAHLITALTLAAYYFPKPEHRLYITAFGSFMSCVAWFSTFSTRTAESSVYAWLLGLIASTAVKAMCRGNNPIWPIMRPENGGWNGVGLTLGLLACAATIHRDMRARRWQLNTTSGELSPISSRETSPNRKLEGKSSFDWVLSSLGFAGLLFALHTIFSDSSTPLRWGVEGYPHTGAQPVPWGALTIAVMSIGLKLASHHVSTSYAWSIIGAVGAIVFAACSRWTSFMGGLVFGVVLFSIAPRLAVSFGAQPIGRSLFLSLLFYNLLLLAHVWTVAYEFVPGGPLLRERTDIVITIMLICLGAGVLKQNKYGNPDVHDNTMHHPSKAKNLEQRRRKVHRLSSKISIFLTIAGLLAYLARIPFQTPQSYIPAEHRAFTAGIWTIHFGIDNDMWASEHRMKAAIEELGLDVVGLLESDLQRVITGNRDLTQSLAESLNMYADYGPAGSKHTWGCTLLSKFPILRSSHHLLPSPYGELACAIHATLDVHGKEVDVIVSHNGQEENLLDRRLQTTEIARIARTTNNPLVFLGYIVSKPFGEIYNILMGDGYLNDVDPTDWDRWCQYIAFRGLKRFGYARVSHGGITDTEIQTAKFQLLDEPHDPDAERALALQRHQQNSGKEPKERIPVGEFVEESAIASPLRYPNQFRGQGVRGHRYHVLNDPRYFN